MSCPKRKDQDLSQAGLSKKSDTPTSPIRSSEARIANKLPLQEVTEPNLLEGMFPHCEPPRIEFTEPFTERLNGQTFTIDPAELKTRDICITDTTFRDGQQARPPYTPEQTVELYDLLARLSGPRGVIRQTEYFLYSKQDREALEGCQARGHRYPEITGWIRAEAEDLHLVKSLGLKETGMLTSCSDYHIFKKLKMDRRKAFEKYTGLAKQALAHGIRPRCHLEDITRADIYGFVIPYVQELMRISEEAPEDLKVKIRLCDTMGFGISYPGSALPRSVPKLVLAMIHEAGVPGERLEWHGHNDFHKVLINGTTAWLYGCNALNSTLLGIGERTGNPPLEGAIFEYISLKQNLCEIDTTVITEIAQYYRQIGTLVPPRAPFVGEQFIKTSAGIHADGLAQDERIYNVFDTTKLLKRPPQVVLTDKSGSDGVYLWVNNFLGLQGEDRLRKMKMVKIMRWVADQYEVEKRNTAISDQEMIELVKTYLPAQYAQAKKEGHLSVVLENIG
jgi:citrate (Re)-synthase